ncbi:hypothetical protein [Geodermatophilus aquaeductus]|uniref:hypothetical protein n=1 Tax=Geodermatophilus aquaeductus TaxID=1564161 RepID=UPI00115C0FA6|nr:hypothetical protein [Geodermatophilus aquaeductus]
MPSGAVCLKDVSAVFGDIDALRGGIDRSFSDQGIGWSRGVLAFSPFLIHLVARGVVPLSGDSPAAGKRGS